MDPIDILMFCIVGFSVLVFLLIQELELRQQSKAKTRTYFLGANDDPEEESRKAEKHLASESFNKVSSFEETENSDEISDDWEGIERTELEKSFGKAVVFVSKKSNADRIDGDLKLQLYGLQKVALEGSCHEPQPITFKFSARAKWNAWQKLGDTSREMAMEKYVNMLAKAVPEWKSEHTGVLRM